VDCFILESLQSEGPAIWAEHAANTKPMIVELRLSVKNRETQPGILQYLKIHEWKNCLESKMDISVNRRQ
jgi:hypothetical protein